MISSNPTSRLLLALACSPLTGAAAQEPDKWTSPNFDPTGVNISGFTVDLDGDTLLVGCSSMNTGSQICVYSVASGALIQTLEPHSSTAAFGSSMSIDAGIVLANQVIQGTARVFAIDALTGDELLELAPAAGSTAQSFARSLDHEGSLAVVGAPTADVPVYESGRAYVFDLTTGQELRQLVAQDASSFDEFGHAVALSGDRVLVGAPSDDSVDLDSGSAYIFDVNTGAQLHKLVAANGVKDAHFGTAVAIDGDRALVGSFQVGITGLATGSAYVFDIASGQQLVELTAGNPSQIGENVTLEGNLAVVSGGSVIDGRVFVFDTLTGLQLDELESLYISGSNGFGSGVSLSGGRVAIGDPLTTLPGASANGVAHVFELPAGQEVLAVGSTGNPTTSDSFGSALDVSGPYAAVGIPGATYVVDISTGLSIASFDKGGSSVAIDGDRVITGAPLDDTVIGNGGAAFVFDTTTGAELFQLTNSAATSGSIFGTSVALAGDLALVGSPEQGNDDRGSAFLFDVSSGVQLFELVPATIGVGDRVGTAVALGGNRALVSSPFREHPGGQGRVYVFDTSTGIQTGDIKPSDGVRRFGSSIAVDGDLMLVGAEGDTPVGSIQSGSAYVFDLQTGQQLFKFLPSPLGHFDRFGASVAIDGNLALVGCPGADGLTSLSGAVYVFSLITGEQLAKLTTSAEGNVQLGSSLAAQDGIFYAGGPGSSEPGVYVFDGPGVPLVYCTGKASSIGCLAAISTTNPSALPVSGAADYSVTATSVHAFKPGLVFAGVQGPTALPFLGGTLCTLPNKRGPVVSSGGSAPETCTGTFTTLVNTGALIPAGLDGGAGNTVWYQWWHRDPQNGAGNLGSALSNAVEIDFL